jgi:hypothetical protein
MDFHPAFQYVHNELVKRGYILRSTHEGRGCSYYYVSGYRTDLLQLRVSDHAKPYLAGNVVDTILSRYDMTEDELLAEIDRADRVFREVENKLARDDGIL